MLFAVICMPVVWKRDDLYSGRWSDKMNSVQDERLIGMQIYMNADFASDGGRGS